jgi:hypothetical protein
VLDLKKFADDFIQNKLQLFDEYNRADEAVLQAINDRKMDHADRKQSILRWLNSYRVLRYFPRDNSINIAGEIIEFADERDQNELNQSKDSIISEYERLGERIRQFAPSLKSGNPRKVTSLTSKALWCCYPCDVPIFDSYALGALRVISRLSRMAPELNQSEYACFVDVWFQVYGEVQSVIEEADLNGYPYKVRVLDRLLWHLGQPSFDTTLGGSSDT